MATGPTGAEPQAISVQTCDLDEAREICGEHLYPRTLRILDRPARLAARFAFLHLDGLTVGDIRYGAEIAGECGPLGSYHVNVPLTGDFVASHCGQLITGGVARAGIYRPVGTNVLLRSSADCHLLAVKIDRAMLENTLGGLLDASVRGHLKLAGVMDIRQGPGLGCARLIRFLGREINNPASLVRHPIVAAPLSESLLISLLYATGHQYHQDLHRPGSRCSSRQVKRAIDAIHAEPQRPYTLRALAEVAGVSMSCLRREFQRQVGRSPMAYVRAIRLKGAHHQLRDAGAAGRSIADVAGRWGFPRPARFTARYLATYGASPAETLSAEGWRQA